MYDIDDYTGNNNNDVGVINRWTSRLPSYVFLRVRAPIFIPTRGLTSLDLLHVSRLWVYRYI